MNTLAGSFAILKNPDIMTFMLKGVFFTVLLAVVSVSAMRHILVLLYVLSCNHT